MTRPTDGADGAHRGWLRGWRRVPGHPVFPLVAEGFLSRLSFGIISLALPLYALQLGMSVAQIGVLLSLNLVVALVLKPLMGGVADRVGLKRSLVAAIGLRSVVSLLFVFASSPWHLFAIRGLHGVSIALRDPATYALVAEAGGKRQIASSFAWYQTSKTLAGSVGRAIAGVVLSLAGGFPLTFAVAFALSVLPLLIVAFRVREPVDPPAEMAPDVTLAAGLDDDPRPAPSPARAPIVPFAMVGFLITGSAYLFTALFPVFATEYAGLSPAAVGFIYVVGSLMALTGPVWGWLADRTSFGLVLSLRSFANVASSVVYLVAPNLGGVAVGKALDDTGKAAFRPAWGAMMAHAASHDRSRRARIMAWLGVGEDAGEVAGPIIAGLVWTAWGIPALLGIRIAAAVAAEVATGFVTRRYGEANMKRTRKSRRQAGRVIGYDDREGSAGDPAPSEAATGTLDDRLVESQLVGGPLVDGRLVAHRQALGFGPASLWDEQSVAGGLGLDAPATGRASPGRHRASPLRPEDQPAADADRQVLANRLDDLASRARELEDLVTSHRRSVDDDRIEVANLARRHDRLVSLVEDALPGLVTDAVKTALEAQSAALLDSLSRAERVRSETEAMGAAVQASAERMLEDLYRRDQEVESRATSHRRRLEEEAMTAVAEMLDRGKEDVTRSVTGGLAPVVHEAVRAAMERYAADWRAGEAEMASRLRAEAEVQQANQRQSFEQMMAVRARELDDRAYAHELAHEEERRAVAQLRDQVTRLVTEAVPAMVDGALEEQAAAYRVALEELRSARARSLPASNGRSGPPSPLSAVDVVGAAPTAGVSRHEKQAPE